MTAFATVMLLQLQQGIVVETDSPDAHCPDLHQTREAVSARLGAIEVKGYGARYTIVHAPGEIARDFVRLELESPEGETLLRRELPVGESCTAVAEAIALVLDQYFRALVTEEVDRDPLLATIGSDASRSVEADSGATPNRGASSPKKTRPSWLAMLEMTALSYSSSIAAGARLEWLFAPAWHGGLEVVVPFSDRIEGLSNGGEARARPFELSAHFGWGPELGAVRPYLAPTLFAMLERGYTTSPLENSTQYRLLGGAGAELGLNVSLDERWRTAAFGSFAGIMAQSASFVVAGDEVLRAIGWTGKAGLAFAYAF
jgi:hypothetical protein